MLDALVNSLGARINYWGGKLTRQLLRKEEGRGREIKAKLDTLALYLGRALDAVS